MITKKFHFPILILFLLIFCSCSNENQSRNKKLYLSFFSKAENYQKSEQLDSAFMYYNKAKIVSVEDDKNDAVLALLAMAEIQKAQCDFTGCELTATEALDLNQQKHFPNIYNLLGIVYQEKFEFDNSLKYYQKAYEITTDDLYKPIIKNNIGVIYLEKKEFRKALNILKPLIHDKTLYEYKTYYAKPVDNLGYAYFKLNEKEKALGFLQQSYKIRDSINDDSEVIASLMHLSEYYVDVDTQKSNEYALKAYNSATKINSPDDRLEALDFLIKNSRTNEFKKFYKIHSSLRDSIDKVRMNAKNEFAKIRYDASLAIKESEKQKSQKRFYMSLFVLVSLASSVLFFFLRNRNRKKLQKVTYETETRISKKLHDELANDVFNAMTFADTQNLDDPDKKEVLVDNLDKIYTQARNISKENSEIDTEENFEPILKTMLSSYSNSEVSVIISQIDSIEWLKMKKETKIVIYRALQELMVNMKKHSHSSHVFIRFENHKNNIEINYSDNGVGCPEMLNFKKGLQNAENRIYAIKGSINFETATKKGFKARMIIPK